MKVPQQLYLVDAREPFVVWVLGVLEYWRLKYCEYREGLATESTRSVSSTEPREYRQNVPAVPKHEKFGVQAISAVRNLEILRVLAVQSPRSKYYRNIAYALQYSSCPQRK